MTNRQTTEQGSSNAKKGFASMPPEKVEEIARMGGEVSASKAGHAGMAERGRQGGEASASKAGHAGMAERGRQGGENAGAQRRKQNEADQENESKEEDDE